MSGLTTHVLDLVAGVPAVGVAVRLANAPGAAVGVRAEAVTDRDGRARLLDAGALQAGGHRLEFDVGAYFRGRGLAGTEPAFFETVVVAFDVEPGRDALHMPLLVSPFGYSTYRGS